MSPTSSGSPRKIAPATGKLGVLTVGLGAVSSTLIAGVDRKSTRLNSSHSGESRMPSSA